MIKIFRDPFKVTKKMLDAIKDMPQIIVYDIKYEILRQNIEPVFMAKANQYRGNPEALKKCFYLTDEQYKNWTLSKCFSHVLDCLDDGRIDVYEFMGIPKERVFPIGINKIHAWDRPLLFGYLQNNGHNMVPMHASVKLSCSLDEAIKKYDALRGCMDTHIRECREQLHAAIQLVKNSPYGPLCCDMDVKEYYS